MSFNFDSLANIGEPVFGHNESFTKTDPDTGVETVCPTGGHAEHSADPDTIPGPRKVRFRIDWQDGPVDRESGEGANGAFVEDVLEVGRLRLEFYEQSSFACPENAAAIKHIQAAVEALVSRRQDRRARGVEGQNKK